MLAFGVDERVLGAPKMSRRLLEEAAAACGGVMLQGFADIRAALQLFAEPYAMQQARAQRTPRLRPPRPGAPGACEGAPEPDTEPGSACEEEGVAEKGAIRCPRRGLAAGVTHRVHVHAPPCTVPHSMHVDHVWCGGCQ